MVKRIDWSNTALKKINEIIAYMKQNASDKAARDFVDAVYKQLESLKKYPQKGRPSPKAKTIREVRIDKHRKMYYRTKGSTIHISTFFDTRQNPKKSPF